MELKSFLPSIYGGSSERVPFRALHHIKKSWLKLPCE